MERAFLFPAFLKVRAAGLAGRSIEKQEACNGDSFSPGEKARMRAGVNQKIGFPSSLIPAFKSVL